MAMGMIDLATPIIVIDLATPIIFYVTISKYGNICELFSPVTTIKLQH